MGAAMTPARRPVIVLVLLALCAVLIGLRLQLTNDLQRLLPASGDLARATELLQRLRVADTVVVEVDGTGSDLDTLRTEVAGIAGRLEDSERFGSVRWQVELSDGVLLRERVTPVSVGLVPEEVLARRVSEAGVKDALTGWLAQLAGPAGGLAVHGLQNDPLDLTGLALDALQDRSGRVAVDTRTGLLLDNSGSRALILAEPRESMLSAGVDAPVSQVVEAALEPAQLPVDWLSGHRHAGEQAARVQRDVRNTALVGITLLSLLVGLGLRSVRPVLGAVVALSPALVFALAAGALRTPLHALSLAFSAAILGVGIDYWLHLVSHAPPDGQARGERAFAAIRPALLLSAASTVGAFAVLTTSGFPVVADLGFMGAAAVLGAVLGVWGLGPRLVDWCGPVRLPSLRLPREAGVGAALLLLASFALLLFVPGSGFQGDPRELIGSSRETRMLERGLGARYGGFGTGGFARAEGETLGEALDLAARLESALSEVPEVSVTSPLALVPGPAAVQARAALLPPREELAARVRRSAVALGLAPEPLVAALERYYDQDAPTVAIWEGTALDDVIGRSLDLDGERPAVVLPVVLSSDRRAEDVARIVEREGGELVLQARVAQQGVLAIREEVGRLSGLATAGVLLLLLFRYRSPRLVLAAFLPCGTALLWATGGMALWGLPFNAVSGTAMVLVLGMGLDYGVFVVESVRREGEPGPAGSAVLLSCLTTVAGFGVLALAQAPAVKGVGVALAFGLTGAMLAALMWTPRLALGEWLLGRRTRTVVHALAWLLLVWLHLDTLIALRFYVPRPSGDEVPEQHELVIEGDLRRYGDDKLGFAHGVYTAHYTGTPFQIGHAHGILARELLAELEHATVRSYFDAVPTWWAQYLIFRGSMLFTAGLDDYLAEDQRQELRGISMVRPDDYPYLSNPYTRDLYYHALHDIGQALVDSPLMACTGFMASPRVTADGHWIMGRNFDFDGGEVFDRDKLIWFVRPTDGYAYVNVSFAGMIGVVSGMNEEGLAVSVNAAAVDSPPRLGMPMTFIIRDVLKYASSLDEAEHILTERGAFVSDAVLVVDGDAGEAALFEVTPRGVARIDVDDALAVSNHFRSPAFADDPVNRHRMETNTTVARLTRMEELLERHRGRIDLPTAVSMLSDRMGPGDTVLPRGHHEAIDADIATHSVVFDVTARTLWVSVFPNTQGGWVSYDLDAGLAGDITPTPVLAPDQPQASMAVHRAREILRGVRWASPADAEAMAREALALMPGHPAPLFALGQALVDQGRRDEARPYLEQARDVGMEYAPQQQQLEALLELL